MLQKLYIDNFILIEKLELDLNKGFCVITGQTGAGKSILLSSLLFCFGGKPALNPVKNGSNFCKVSAVFTPDLETKDYLQKAGIKSLSEITITCEQSLSGRKKFFINNEQTIIKVVQGLLPMLLEIHSQHHHTSLLDESQHISILDNYLENEQLRLEVKDSYNQLQVLKRKRDEYEKIQEEIRDDIEYLEHICQELEQLNLQDGEEEKLIEIKRSLQSYDKRRQLVQELADKLQNISVGQIFFDLQNSENDLGEFDEYKNALTDLDSAYDKIENVKSSMDDLLMQIQPPEYSIEEVEERLHAIRSLARKHSIHSSELRSFLQKSQNKLEDLHTQVKDSTQNAQEISFLEEKYNKLAQELSDQRQKGGVLLAKKVMSELKFLDMKKAIFQVSVDNSNSKSSSLGVDEVSFVAATNPGSKLSNLAKVASGGELARFMLALRVVLFNKTAQKTIIFDEVDIGISGSVADAVGERLKTLASSVQTIVITHQPQVAGKADQHILVAKTQSIDHTISIAKQINGNEQLREIARMISGKEITDAGLKAAKELLI